MKHLLARYGGQLFMITDRGIKKAGVSEESEDQSFDYVIKNKAIPMDGFSYLSSYDHLYNFMGAHDKLPKGTVKIGDIHHEFVEISFQYDIYVDTSVYLGFTGYSNLFCIYIKTDFRELELVLDKMKSTYDLVLVIRVLGKTNEEINQSMGNIILSMIGLLLFEMDIWQTEFEFIPSKTYIGKKLNQEKTKKMLQELKAIENRESLSDFLKI